VTTRSDRDWAIPGGLDLDSNDALRSLAIWGAQYLRGHSVPNPQNNAEWILCDAMTCNRLDIYLGAPARLEPERCETYFLNIRRRGRREPLQYILGTTEFMSLPFHTPPGVFVPRPDTEVLVEVAESLLRRMPLAPRQKILDLCCGSGVIAVSLAHRIPNAEVWAVDASVDATRVTATNAAMNGVDARVRTVEGTAFGFLDGNAASNATDAIPDGFSAIVCNPPYIRSDDLASLPPEVRDHEPMTALDGGRDGLDFYREMVPILPRWIDPGGIAVFEVGDTQGAEVSGIMGRAGFTGVVITPDYAGHDRVVSGVMVV